MSTLDSNSLNRRFYHELLHLMGLTETRQGSKRAIVRKKEGKREGGSFLEKAIEQLQKLAIDQPFPLALELTLTWISRILFFKFLESQLVKVNQGNGDYKFLHQVKNYQILNGLFFGVTSCKPPQREPNLQKIFSQVPYLNSSLFELTELEQKTIMISNLIDTSLPIFTGTVLKDKQGKKRSGELGTLQYLFEFLDAYNFVDLPQPPLTRGEFDPPQEFVNASVLGLIFEKINGYQDGSFFTPGFITMFMSRESIRLGVVQKFNEVKGWDCQNFDQLDDKIEDIAEANQIINSLKICDLAVGSGHFLVSALNEMIAIKSELKILHDREGKRLKEYQVKVSNDQLIITREGKVFEYNPKSKESQRVQEALFKEKKTILTNCLFGVDINPNSVKICRLRLWIELLKSIYYQQDSPLSPGETEKPNLSQLSLTKGETVIGDLETLPNIDTNIKCGNSLIAFKWCCEFPQVLNDQGDFVGFDVAIGNPPYIKEYEGKQIFDGLRERDVYQGKMDLWYLFAAQGLDLLKVNGLLAFIAQNNWVTSAGAAKFRNKVLNSAKIELMLDFGSYLVFDAAGIQTMIMVFRKNEGSDRYSFDYRHGKGSNLIFNDALDLIHKNPNPQIEFLNPIVIKENLINQTWNFSNNQIKIILEKMLDQQNFNLDEKKEVAQGLIFPQDFINKASQEKLNFVVQVGDGVFALSQSEKNNLNLNPQELSLIKPYYTTKQLGRYYRNSQQHLWLIYTDSKYKNPAAMSNYPNLQKHLDRFQEIITSANKPYGLHRAREERFFIGEKIIVLRKCPQQPVFTYTDFDCYVSATFYIIKTDRINQKYLTGLLNSKLITYWLRHQGKMQGNNFQIDKEPLLKIPIFRPDQQIQAQLAALVREIITIKKTAFPRETTTLEQAIDDIVYQLYNLTATEITLVEEGYSIFCGKEWSLDNYKS